MCSRARMKLLTFRSSRASVSSGKITSSLRTVSKELLGELEAALTPWDRQVDVDSAHRPVAHGQGQQHGERKLPVSRQPSPLVRQRTGAGSPTSTSTCWSGPISTGKGSPGEQL